MMFSLTNPGLAGDSDLLLNLTEFHQEDQVQYLFSFGQNALFLLSPHIEFLDLTLERVQTDDQSSPSSMSEQSAIVRIRFLNANNAEVSSRVMNLYFAARGFDGYPLFLIKPQTATQLEISVSYIDAKLTLHSRLLVI
ncbi:hypothetical protein F0248_08425 [Vibrio crassostreae]|uniref:hypothetical protein n=1 Tax=Vibrio crassostreae TaxID=246167 RepID=UPI00148D4BEC|nr:hypothetical protein [Vibrio crassostreae]NOI53106.1 hypothetical protein [Vibrio crassostreae]CAK2915211.1 conserved hypothetical protein [Vibrio crassostreae]CAK3322007.1 conserved hypothetical protein [Vibrio crassostreae]CAK3411996.1 conserved hypothetical protein [Vibrio crassostreae]CAK3423845.1 conserved hypothetical protein [Vibrio crassostreae]